MSVDSALSVIEDGIAQGLHFGAQLCVYHHDRLLCDVALGRNAENEKLTTEHWMNWFSAGKPIVAAGVMKLWQWGRFDLDDPVAKYIPKFATHGKEAITIRHLLTHTAGLRVVHTGWPRAGWEQILGAICDMKMEEGWEPGKKAGYNALTTWFLLGEIIRILDTDLHRSAELFLRDEILEPAGMHDTWPALTAEQIERYPERFGHMYDTTKSHAIASENSSLVTHHLSFPSPSDWSRPPKLTTFSPGSSLRGPAHDMARFYRMLLKQGRLDGVEVLAPTTVQMMTAAHRVGMYDHTFYFPVPWGLGFILTPAPAPAPGTGTASGTGIPGTQLPPYGFGPTASEGSFGHSGYQSSTVFADPKMELVVALVCNGMCGNRRHDQRTNSIVSAIYSDLHLV